MVTREGAWPSGTLCWVDLGVADIPRAGRFYSRLFGWEIQPGPPEAGGYTVCLQAGRPVAGIGPQLSPDSAPSWAVYLATGDADATASAITAAGGQTLIAPREVMDAGRMAFATDPGGAVFGIWQAGRHTGFGLANEPGAVCWNENFSRDLAGNQAFYQQVFGYDYGALPDPDFRYATIKLGGTEVGGIGELGSGFPPEVPAHWSTYFAVDDADAAVETIVAAGGAVQRAPWDTPYGRMAVARDDQSAVFSLMCLPGTAAG